MKEVASGNILNEIEVKPQRNCKGNIKCPFDLPYDKNGKQPSDDDPTAGNASAQMDEDSPH